MYYCKTQGCLWKKKRYTSITAGLCQECKQSLQLEIEYDEFEKDIVNNYPYVIAFPFKRMIESQSYIYKFNILIKDVFLNSLKFLALVSATEYFRSPFKSDELNLFFREKLSRPLYGSWNAFLEMSIDFLESKGHRFFVKEMPFVYHKVQTGKKHNIVKLYPLKKEFTNWFGERQEYIVKVHGNRHTAINVLLAFRNDELSHAPTLTEADYKKLYFICYPILRDLLSEISFCKNYPMYKADRKFFWTLMGTEVKQAGTLTELIQQDENIWLQDSEGKRLPLLPFFVQPYTINSASRSEILIYEGTSSNRIIFHSPESIKDETNDPDYVNKLSVLLANKEREDSISAALLTRELLQQKLQIQNSLVQKELINEWKIIPGVYQKREEAELELKAWVGSLAGLFFLYAESGTGKTNLLWDMHRQYTERGFDTMFLRAGRFAKETLKDELLYNLNLTDSFDFSKSIFNEYSQANPFIVLLDGGNEHVNVPKLLESIKELLLILPLGAFKVVLSWRINTKDELPRLDESWQSLIYNTNANKEKQGSILTHYGYCLLPMDKLELASAWDNYINLPAERKRYQPNFALNDLAVKDKMLADQLHNPLLLRMFLEIFNKKNLPATNQGFINIWELWWAFYISEKGKNEEFIIRLALRIIDNKATSILLDELYDDEVLGSSVRNYMKDSPYQQLVKMGIITQFTRDNHFYVTFTMDGYFHYSLCRYLSIKEAKLNELAKLFKENNQWANPVEYYLLEQISKNNSYFLTEAVKQRLFNVDILSFSLVQTLKLNNGKKILDRILKDAEDYEWILLNNSLETIKTINNEELLRTTLKKIKKHVNFDNWECINILSENVTSFNKDFSKQISEKFILIFDQSIEIQRKNNLCNALEMYYNMIGQYDEALNYAKIGLRYKTKLTTNRAIVADSFNRIGDYLCSLGRFEEALESNETALNLRLSIFSDDHVENSKSYNGIGLVCLKKGNFDKAMQCYQKSLHIKLKYYGEYHPDISAVYNNIGFILSQNGEIDKALELYEKSLKIRTMFCVENHPDVATLHNNIGNILLRKREFDKSIERFHKSLQIELNFYGNEHPDIAISYNNIGYVWKEKGELELALRYYEQSLQLRVKFYGDQHLAVATVYNNIGYVWKEKGELDLALKYFNKSIEIYLNYYDEDHLEILNSRRIIEEIYAERDGS